MTNQLTPLRRRSVVDEAYEVLRARILHGVWAAGDKLATEAELTAALGVSRSTLREALNRLASAGLIEIPHGGTKVVRDWRDHAGLEVLGALVASPEGGINPAIVRAVTQMRSAIAPDTARLAALHAEPERIERLRELAEGLDAEGDLEELLIATLEWWTELVLASGNLAYRLAHNTLRTTYMEGRGPLLGVIADELQAAPLYRSISAAIAARDEDQAERGCRELVALGADALFQALDAYEALSGA